MNPYERLSPWIQDHIYRKGWETLRPVQVAACEVLFQTEDNLLLSSGTASGKTEAAFLPALTILSEHPSASVGILYISPLKALINDQFVRLGSLLEEGGIQLTKWHGDASQGGKQKLLQNPTGVLQITPESLESLLTRRPKDASNLFRDLRFVIADEVAAFCQGVRGIHLQCLLERVDRCSSSKTPDGKAVNPPRRIGLSATIHPESAAAFGRWLSSGQNRRTQHPIVPAAKRNLGIGMEYFHPQAENEEEDQKTHFEEDILADSYAFWLYENTLGKKTIVFAKSRMGTESVAATLKKVAALCRTPDVYRVHHGSISAALRESAEREMKQSDRPLVTAATVTLELGIDIGSLDRVVQIGAPLTASSFAQRIGRCGRQGQRAELLFAVFNESVAIPGDVLSYFNWDFLKSIAIIQLYLEKRWVEPLPENASLPYGVLYHQTMACLLSLGGFAPAARLAQEVLTLAAFKDIPQDDYKALLKHMIETRHLDKDERGLLLVGPEGERIINSYEFLSVFVAEEEFKVLYKQQVIGSLTQTYVVPGARISLAGKSWIVTNMDEKRKTITVEPTQGRSESVWVSPYEGPLDPVVHERIRQVLLEDTDYAYLSPVCKERLKDMRLMAREHMILEKPVFQTAEDSLCLFLWSGDKVLRTIQAALRLWHVKGEFAPAETLPVYLNFESITQGAEYVENALHALAKDGISADLLPLPAKWEAFSKFDPYVPQSLLDKQYRTEKYDPQALQTVLRAAEL
ncbi:MAG: DEAD/DEAH box helicase [Oscillospiraceae bacterium]|jgi:ATP-dependent Lhr-like helicase|nr:DEAD/DEAH box helicase [Oscillospiraceae bacterium]